MRMNPFLAKWGERGIGTFKYLIAGYMMLVGALTPFSTVAANGGGLGFLYSNPYSLVIIGSLIFLSGATLLYGKLRKSKRWTGRGLMWIYMCFVFAAILNFIVFSGDITYWLGNVIFALITGALWLRWKFKTEYVNHKHFVRDIDELIKDQP